MLLTQGNAGDAGRRSLGFLDTQAAIIGTAVPPSLRAKLDAAVTQLTQSQQEQDAAATAAMGETAAQVVLRKDLYDNLVGPISQAARMALRAAPDFGALVVTSNSQRSADFLTKVNSQITAAAKYQPVLLDHGVPTDCIAQVQAAVTQITASEDTRARALSRKSAATSGLATADSAIRATIKMISGVLSPVLKKNPTLKADWIASKRIRQLPVTPLPTASVTAPTTAATTPTTTPATAPAVTTQDQTPKPAA